MQVTPGRLNSMIAWLFMIGSSCFVVGSVPAYLNAVGGPIDGVTYFVGSIFFTAASLFQLTQAQTPGTTGVDAAAARRPVRLQWLAWLPRERGWLAAVTQFPGTLFFNVSTLAALARNASVAQDQRHVWRPDLYGSILFLVSSVFGLLAVARLSDGRREPAPWRIGWWNMIGSILFMISALAGYILPSGQVLSTRISVAGTFAGAVCFLVGAALLLPAWRAAVGAATRPTERTQPT